MSLNDHSRSILIALFVTFLWSTSWVLIKLGLEDIPALTFAGLRYTLATLMLLPFALKSITVRQQSRALTSKDWFLLTALGLVFYTLTQGAQFLGLVYLPAVMLSLLLNLTSIITALFGIFLLKEIPGRRQWLGIAIFIIGALIYFYPLQFPAQVMLGIVIGLAGVLANAGAGILGRYINRTAHLSPLTVTIISMGIGSGVLLITGLLIEGLPTLTIKGWAIIGWLAAVNTAFAFTLWNRSLQHLSAVESSVINNTMLIQIAFLAWLFLGETITTLEGIGLAVAVIGILLVQIKRQGNRTIG